MEYCTTQDSCSKGRLVRPESVPAPNPVCFLILPASDSSQLSAGSDAQTKPNQPCKELEKFLTCTVASSPHNDAPVPNARGQCSNWSLQRFQNGEQRSSLSIEPPRAFTPTCSLTPTSHDQLCTQKYSCSNGDGTLISRGRSFQVKSPFFPVESVNLFTGQRDQNQS